MAASYTKRSSAIFDANEDAKNSPWSKALMKYRSKGMADQEIDKYRQAYQSKPKTSDVTSLASRSKKK